MKIKDTIVELASSQLERDFSDIELDTDLSTLDVDSLDLVELIMAIEEAFNIEISDEELEDVVSLEAAIDLVSAKTRT